MIKRKAAWLPHVVCHGVLTATVVDGMPEGCQADQRYTGWIIPENGQVGIPPNSKQQYWKDVAKVGAIPVVPAGCILGKRPPAKAYVL